MPNWERIAAVDEVAPGERKSVIVDELPALLLRVGDNYFCIEDVCSHDGQPTVPDCLSVLSVARSPAGPGRHTL